MADLRVTIGGRDFDVSCQEGEEHFLQAAAAMLDAEASVLAGQLGRIPEARMLLMAGLMLADKAAGTEDTMRQLRERVAELEAALAAAKANPQRVEVPVIPATVTDTLAEIAARAEALADKVEETATEVPAEAEG
ncbi:cell division protein ZapA [Rhodobacter aestuarii]|uniref:Cell division protein ZapA n=1 Tax=Rhodobacter aestuarii TaxID=453582 RepID=A0A1N7M5R2_9RHOB|nr:MULTISPECIES: cell division protein ZapA [Rhodobacter]PTV94864.1 cell division protein ZapA [Rhodobacter aestuarii]SIS81420.1 cell division protein ZapA [Rhodobacter aestuarii]SOC14086.1 cell division protein ZapA [Rhodobacter sp. JA431]